MGFQEFLVNLPIAITFCYQRLAISFLLKFTMATGLWRGEVCGLKREYMDFIGVRSMSIRR